MRAVESESCEHCGRPLQVDGGVGRPRKYCRRSCRQRAYEARRHEGDLAWGDARIVAMARELAELEDALDRVAAAVDELRVDVDDDHGPTPRVILERLERALGR